MPTGLLPSLEYILSGQSLCLTDLASVTLLVNEQPILLCQLLCIIPCHKLEAEYQMAWCGLPTA